MIKYEKISSLNNYKYLLINFFKEVKFGRYLSDYRLDFTSSVKYEIKNIIEYAKNGNLCFAIDSSNEIIGLLGYHFSEWDTGIFNKRVAIIKYLLVKENQLYENISIAEHLLKIFHDWVSENKIDVAITKLETNLFTPIYLLQQMNYMFYECITIQTIDVKTVKNLQINSNNFRYATQDDFDIIREIALKNTFLRSHFFLDPGFIRSNIENMYSKWIETALSSNQKIVVIEHEKNICGLFVYELLDLSEYFGKKFAIWKFAAVDSRFRGKGLGNLLFNATFQSCIENKSDIIDTSLVVKNTYSQSIHNRLGFRLVNSLFTFHKWFK